MNTCSIPSYAKKTSQARGKSPGWAAVDLQQRQKQGLIPHQVVGDDPFPPLPTTSIRPSGNCLPSNNVFPSRSFSSIFLPRASSSAAALPSITDNNVNCNKATQVSYSSGLVEVKGNKPDFAFPQLMASDKSLIQDVIVTVNNTDSSDENGGTEIFSNRDKGKNSNLAADIADLSSALEDALKENYKDSKEDLPNACGLGFSVSEEVAANMKLILRHLRSLPVEPEWEEDDVYLSHRRKALNMMRLASRHSRAATNAFLRGDHYLAQQQSLKAHKEWLDAERLNSKAAKEILSIRNGENNPWKLDLHGLHAAEAVQALKEHLQEIETQLPVNQPVPPSTINARFGNLCSSLVRFSAMDIQNLDKQQTGFRRRLASLQVITGVGNHSRGQAALPTAVRSFLSENRYLFDEARPGVIAVCPKLRYR